jgi:AcrR family transcriptional regulator
MNEEVWLRVLGDIKDLKKRKIIEAALSIISTHGIESLTFESVGERLDTTKANIRYHFQSKDDLIFLVTKVVVINAQLITAQLVEKAATPELKLRAIIGGAYQWCRQYPEQISCWAMYFYYSTLFTPYMKFFTEVRATGTSRMEMILRALPQKNASRDISHLQIADTIQNVITGQIIGTVHEAKGLAKNEAQTYHIVELLLLSAGIQWHD